MIVTVLVIVAGFAFAGFLLLVVVRGGPASSGTLDDIGVYTRPVDLLAFRNLTDPAEEAFLRQRLERASFRKLERERLRAAVEYVQRAAWNAAVLLRVGESLRRERPEMAAVGQDLAAAALRLRLNALAVLVLLHVRLWLPGVEISFGQLVGRYEEAREHLARVARVQRPAHVSHMLAGL